MKITKLKKSTIDNGSIQLSEWVERGPAETMFIQFKMERPCVIELSGKAEQQKIEAEAIANSIVTRLKLLTRVIDEGENDELFDKLIDINELWDKKPTWEPLHKLFSPTEGGTKIFDVPEIEIMAFCPKGTEDKLFMITP